MSDLLRVWVEEHLAEPLANDEARLIALLDEAADTDDQDVTEPVGTLPADLPRRALFPTYKTTEGGARLLYSEARPTGLPTAPPVTAKD